MKNNLIRTLILTIIMIMSITSVCFADLMVGPYTNVGAFANIIGPISAIVLVIFTILFISFKLLLKLTKEDEKKEKYKKELEKLLYYIFICIVILTATEMDVLAIIPFAFVITSLLIRLFKKDNEKSIALLFAYIKGLIILIFSIYVLEILW